MTKLFLLLISISVFAGVHPKAPIHPAAKKAADWNRDGHVLVKLWDLYKKNVAEHSGTPYVMLRSAAKTLAEDKTNPRTAYGEGTLGVLSQISSMDWTNPESIVIYKQAGLNPFELTNLKEIAEMLKGHENALAEFQRGAIITEGEAQYRIPGGYKAFDRKKHTQEGSAKGDGYVHAPHSDPLIFDKDSYIKPGPHLYGKQIRLGMFFFDIGTRMLEGRLIGTLNDKWETLLVQEKRSGDKIAVPAKNGPNDPSPGMPVEMAIKTDPGISEEQFAEKFQDKKASVVKSYINWRDIGSGDDTRAYLVDFGTHREVVIGKGTYQREKGNINRTWYEYIRIENENGVYYFPHRRLLAYTKSKVDPEVK